MSLRTELEVLFRKGRSVPTQAFNALRRIVGRKQAEANADMDHLAELCGVLCDAQAPENQELAAQLDHQFPNLKGELNMASIDREGEQFSKNLTNQLENATTDSAELDQLLQEASNLLQDTSDPSPPAITEPTAAEEEPSLATAVEANESTASESDSVGEISLNSENPSETLSEDASAIEAMDPEMAQLLAETDTASIIAAGPEPVEAVEQVSNALDSAESEIDALASAFEQATSELNTTGEELDPAATLPSSDTSEPSADESSATPPPAVATNTPNAPVASIRERIVAEVQSLVQLLDELEQQDARAKAVLSQAAAFTEAIGLTQQAEAAFQAAQTDAQQAQNAYEQAQQRLEQTRKNWEAAQQQAASVAIKLQT